MLKLRSLVLSTFTKVLVVLLSLSCIFLSGATVSYVAKSNDAVKENEQLNNDIKNIKAQSNIDARAANEKRIADALEIKKLQTEKVALENENQNMMIDLKNAQRAAIKWEDRSLSWEGVVIGFEQTISDMQKSLISTRDLLAKEQKKSIKASNDLNDITIALDEHIVMLESLKAEKKRLLEQKAMLEKQVDALASGKKIPAVTPVTQVPDMATPAETNSYSNAIQGLVTEVAPNLVSLSIGTADGVSTGMKFHVTRGDRFICDLLVTDVDVDKAAAIIELKNASPKIGDTASTEL